MAAVVAAGLVALTACGTGDAGSTDAASPTAGASVAQKAPADRTASGAGSSDCAGSDVRAIGQASQRFGEQMVAAALCSMVRLQREQGFRPELMRKHEGYREADFSAVRAWMTTSTGDDWDSYVAATVEGDAQHQESMWGLVLFGVRFDEGWQLYESGEQPVVLDLEFSRGDAWIDDSQERPRLGLEFHIAGDLLVHKPAKPEVPHAFPFQKKVTLALSEAGGTPESHGG